MQHGLSVNNAGYIEAGEKGGNHKADNIAQSTCKRLQKGENREHHRMCRCCSM